MTLEKFPVSPACEGMSRKEITSLLSNELVRCKLERRNAYSYWAHEVEMHDYAKHTTVWVDFVQFEPDWYHTATHAGCVERGTFTFYEIKSCLDDLKSGNGMNLFGDRNYVVMPVEVYTKLTQARADGNKKVLDAFKNCSFLDTGFLLYGKRKNGTVGFHEIEPSVHGGCRKKPAAELLLCMMRAMIANSGRSDVQHKIEQGKELGE